MILFKRSYIVFCIGLFLLFFFEPYFNSTIGNNQVTQLLRLAGVLLILFSPRLKIVIKLSILALFLLCKFMVIIKNYNEHYKLYSYENGTYYLLKGKTGFMTIIYDEPNGIKHERGSLVDYHDGDRQYGIPEDRLLIIRLPKPTNGGIFYYIEGNKHSSIQYYHSNKNNDNINKVYVFRHRIGKDSIHNIAFKYESFFVGTKRQYNLIADTPAINTTNRDTIYYRLKRIRQGRQ